MLHRGQGLGGGQWVLPFSPQLRAGGSLGSAGRESGAGAALLAGDSRWQQEIQVPLLRVRRQGPCELPSSWHFTRGQESAAQGWLLSWGR